MGDSMTLSKDELKEVTGYTHRAKQAWWLAQLELPFLESPDGRPVVLRSTLEQRLDCQKRRPRKATEPDIEALRAIQNGQTKKGE